MSTDNEERPHERPLSLPCCVPHFCSMKITQEVREYAKTQGLADDSAAIAQGLREKAEEFKKIGSRLYVPKP